MKLRSTRCCRIWSGKAHDIVRGPWQHVCLRLAELWVEQAEKDEGTLSVPGALVLGSLRSNIAYTWHFAMELDVRIATRPLEGKRTKNFYFMEARTIG
jgi:hypothetical protein